MKYITSPYTKPRARAVLIATVTIISLWLYLVLVSVNAVMPVSTLAEGTGSVLDKPYSPVTPTPTMTQMDKQALWIAEYAQKYEKPKIGKSKSLVGYQLACLAHKENGWHSNDHCGDDGLACGEFQFHQATWIEFRTEMIREGLITEIGSRLDDQQATETTAWAITHGHDNDWGPLLRGECQ